MSDVSFRMSHRQLVSAVISLVLPRPNRPPPVLQELGYLLRSVELPLADRHGRPFQVDVHLSNDIWNLSLLIDCKTFVGLLNGEQVGKYLATRGAEVIMASGITVADPRAHLADAVFFVLPDVEPALAALLRTQSNRSADGLGVVLVHPERIGIVHDELTDTDLSRSLSIGWDIDVQRLPLERLPYDLYSHRWELADAMFRAILSLFLKGWSEFGVEDLCVESNPLWQFLEPSHEELRERVRNMIRTLRRVALDGWIAPVAVPSGKEESWRFKRKSTTNRNVLNGFRRRHNRYVSIWVEEGRDPRREDFANIDPEQLRLYIPNADE